MTNLPLNHCTIDGQQGLRRIDGVTDYVTTLRLFVRLGWLVTQPSVYGASLHMPIVAVAGRFAEADFGILLKSALKNDSSVGMRGRFVEKDR